MSILSGTMAKLTIRELAEANEIENAYGLQVKAELPPRTAARLWKGNATSISLQIIQKICDTFQRLKVSLQRQRGALRRLRSQTQLLGCSVAVAVAVSTPMAG